MARKRTQKNHHALPKYVYIRRGWYVYREHLGQGKLGKDIKLCPEAAPISEVWQRYESLTCIGAPRKTLDWLFTQFLASAKYAEKSEKTRREYQKNANTISQTPIKSGEKFGQIDAERITRGVIQKYIDARKKADGTPAPVAANREVAFISVCYNWACNRDLLKTNPCLGVDRNSEKARDRYVSEREYRIVYDMAAAWPHIQCAMEFAYLCRMRLGEVLDLKYSDMTDTGLLIRRTKGSRNNITTWSPRLTAAVQQAKSLPMPQARPINPYLIRGKKGHKITESGFNDIWQPLMAEAVAAGIERFHFHDLKAAGVSDTEGDKQQASGHKTAAMVSVYDRKLAEVKPAGKE